MSRVKIELTHFNPHTEVREVRIEPGEQFFFLLFSLSCIKGQRTFFKLASLFITLHFLVFTGPVLFQLMVDTVSGVCTLLAVLPVGVGDKSEPDSVITLSHSTMEETANGLDRLMRQDLVTLSTAQVSAYLKMFLSFELCCTCFVSFFFFAWA